MIRRLRWLAPLLTASLTLTMFGAPVTATAATPADETTPSIQITLDSLRPLIPSPKKPLKLAGTVTNSGNSDLSAIVVALRLGDRITSRDTLAEISKGNYSPSTRGVNNGTIQLSNPLTPGASATWSMTVQPSDLGLYTSGAYYLRMDASSDEGAYGTASSYLPWFPDPTAVTPTQVVWFWPIADTPNRDAANTFLNDQTPTSLQPDGRLSRLLDLGLAAKQQVEWVIDPEALESINVIAGGYQVRGTDGPVQVGPSASAAQWLATARSGLTDASVHASAYADPDATALTRANMPETVVQATTTASQQVASLLGRPVDDTLGWPPGKRTDQRTLDLLQRTGIKTVVLPNDALPDTSGSSQTTTGTALLRTESGPMQAVLVDQTLTDSLGSVTDSASAALSARQRFLAETAVITTSSNGSPPIVVVGPSQRWDPNPNTVHDLLSALARSPWARSTSLRTLLGAEVPDDNRSLAPMNAASKREGLNPDYLADIERTQSKLSTFSTIFDNPGVVTEPFSSALLRTSSGAWRTNRRAGEQLLDVINQQLDGTIGKVRLISGGAINLSGDGGQIPITIANDLPVPVKVGVRLQGDPAVRLVSTPLDTMTIPANRKVSTEISAKVVGSGDLDVQAQLTTPGGALYGQPVELVLRSTAYAVAATWVVLIAFVILSFLLIMNSIRRRKQRRDELADTTDSAGSTDVHV